MFGNDTVTHVTLPQLGNIRVVAANPVTNNVPVGLQSGVGSHSGVYPSRISTCKIADMTPIQIFQ
jgi:hypothetical protein